MDKLFNPSSIAIIGASNDSLKAGYTILHNLLKKGYQGDLYPIHYKEKNLQGVDTFESLTSLDKDVDLLVLCMPARLTENVVNDINGLTGSGKKIEYMVVAAADYAETKSDEGIERQRILMQCAKDNNIRVLGPNCIGVINGANGVDTTFIETGVESDLVKEKNGGISFISQSGSVASCILMEGDSMPVPMKFNKFISIGNMADLDFIDFLNYLKDDESTKVIGLYMEGYPEARKLLSTLSEVTKVKPVVVFKVGRSTYGAQAASSHTGSMAGSDNVYSAAFKQAGVVRVDTFNELFDTLRAFDELPLPKDRNSYILTQTGGFGIHSTDIVEEVGNIEMVDLNEDLTQKLIDSIPAMSSVGHPTGYADITVAASVAQHVESLRIVLEDPNVSSVIFITVLPSYVEQPGLGIELAKLLENAKKPVLVSIMAGEFVMPSRKALEVKSIPTYDNPRGMVIALSHLIKYAEYRNKMEGKV